MLSTPMKVAEMPARNARVDPSRVIGYPTQAQEACKLWTFTAAAVLREGRGDRVASGDNNEAVHRNISASSDRFTSGRRSELNHWRSVWQPHQYTTMVWQTL